MALASALTVAATAIVAGPQAAGASLPGGSQRALTISNGGTSVFEISECCQQYHYNRNQEQMRDISFSPDGSQLTYLAPDDTIKSHRYTGSNPVREVVWEPIPGNRRAGTSWLGDGSAVLWAERWAYNNRWAVELGPSTWSAGRESISPPDPSRHFRNPDGGPGRLVVFQREEDDGAGNPTGQPAVLLWDGSKPEDSRITVVDEHGANPSISPDGTRVAFVRAGQIITSDLTGGNEIVVTSNDALHDDPVWSPDGRVISFRQGNGVATAPADGSAAANPTFRTSWGTNPNYRPFRKDRVARLGGDSRFTTSAKVSQSHWATVNNSADKRERAASVVLSRSDTFADALGGSALAAAKRGPLLLTPPAALEANTRAELQRVLAPGGTVYLLGNAGALSTGVEDAVRSLGYQVRRLAGPDRFATAVEIAKEMRADPGLIFVASGMDFPDALAAGAAAGVQYSFAPIPRGVVVLTNDAVMPAATRAYLDSLPNKTIFGIGRAAAPATAYDDEAFSIVGADRYDTARQVARIFFSGPRYAGVATGADWPDALAGGALMGAVDGPLLLTPGTATSLGAPALDALGEFSGAVHTGLVFGSAPVLSDDQLTQVGAAVSGPLGATTVVNPTDIGLTTRSASAPTARGATDATRRADERTVAGVRLFAGSTPR